MKSPTWLYCSSIYLPGRHCTLYRDDDLGVQLQVMVKRRWIMRPDREKRFYFIDGVNRAFRSSEALVDALAIRNERKPVPRASPDRKNTVSFRR